MFRTLALLPFLFVSNVVVAVERPNIVFIFVDDLGYGDIGCYGGKEIPTPAIDSLAENGVRFTDAYVTAPVCAPSRIGLLTGAYQQRLGVYANPDIDRVFNSRKPFPQGHLLLPQALADGGYVTGMVGKWNITPDPAEFVDEVHSVMKFDGGYYANPDGTFPGVNGTRKNTSEGWGPPRDDAPYLTDRLTDDAIAFVQRHREDPFFLYLSYNAPHNPMQADRKYDQVFSHILPEPRRIYCGMVASLDENIGRLLAALEKTGLDQETLVVFMSDNGPEVRDDYTLGLPGELRGHKYKLYEGGIREPLIMRWPGQFQPGGVYRKPVSALDLYPTFCAAGGVSLPKNTTLDGVDLLPFMALRKN